MGFMGFKVMKRMKVDEDGEEHLKEEEEDEEQNKGEERENHEREKEGDLKFFVFFFIKRNLNGTNKIEKEFY